MLVRELVEPIDGQEKVSSVAASAVVIVVPAIEIDVVVAVVGTLAADVVIVVHILFAFDVAAIPIPFHCRASSVRTFL